MGGCRIDDGEKVDSSSRSRKNMYCLLMDTPFTISETVGQNKANIFQCIFFVLLCFFNVVYFTQSYQEKILWIMVLVLTSCL